MKTYPHATPDGIIQTVELAELEKVKLAAIGLEAECAGLRADVQECNERLTKQQSDMLDTIVKLRAELTSWQAMAAQYSAEREHNANMAGMWQAMAERLATALDNLSHDCTNHSKDIQKIRWGHDGDGGAILSAEQIEECCNAAKLDLAAYESVKKGLPQMFTPCESCEAPLVCSDLGNCYAAKHVNETDFATKDPLAEAVKRMEAVPCPPSAFTNTQWGFAKKQFISAAYEAAKSDDLPDPPLFEYRGKMYMRPCDRGVVLEDISKQFDNDVLPEGDFVCEIRVWKGEQP